MGLLEFANDPARSNKGGSCWTCSIPEREEIDRAHREHGIGPSTIMEWLIAECGYPEEQRHRVHSIKSHFNAKHDHG